MDHSKISLLTEDEVNKQAEIIYHELLFEQIEKGWRHPDGTAKTLKNMHENRMPKETCH